MQKQEAIKTEATVKEIKTNHVKRIIIPVVMGIFIFLICLIAGFAIYKTSFEDKVYPGVKIAGYDAGGLTKQEAISLIDKKINNIKSSPLVFAYKDISEEELSCDQLGITFDEKATLQNAWDIVRSEDSYLEEFEQMLKTLFYESDAEVVMVFDQDKFESKINEIFQDKLTGAEDAKFEIIDDKLAIVGQKNGYEVDFEKLQSDIEKEVNNDEFANIKVSINEVIPNITTEDIKQVTDQVENIINKNINFTYNYKNYNPDKTEKLKWVKLEKADQKIAVNYNDEAIKAYLTDLSMYTDKKVENRKVDADTGAVISEGNDGLELNVEAVFNQLKNDINNESIEIALQVQTITKQEEQVRQATTGGTPGLANGRYLEVNLSTQILYMFEGDNQIGSYIVSTGMWSMPTPVGTRYIGSKNPMAWSATYGLYMPWWMDIGGGYGIHELPEWPNGYKEGEDHLGTPVSHGCIRLGVGAAEVVYNWSPSGTPVFIHY